MTGLIHKILGMIIVIGGIMTISSKNPIHSVLNLVLTFIGMGVLLLYMGLEIIPIIIIIVYVGAIAILFLFVIMMINIKSEELKENSTRYIPIGIFIGLVFIFEVIIIGNQEISSNLKELILSNENLVLYTESNINLLGFQLYSRNWEILLFGGLIIFIGMYGAIILSMLQEKYVKKQDLY